MSRTSGNWYSGNSAYFEGAIGQPLAATRVPRKNYIHNLREYDYEGNWAFAIIDDNDIYAARFGYGIGAFDGMDFGAGEKKFRNYLFAHVEFLTREGAVLWLCADRYHASDVAIQTDKHDINLADGDVQVIRIGGWPRVEWSMSSPEKEIGLFCTLDIATVTILPDFIMRANRFAIWLAIGTLAGTVRYQGKTRKIKGTVFYDHPRIKMIKNDVAPFSSFLYTPTRLSDGSYFVAYHTEDMNKNAICDNCYGILISAEGKACWLRQDRLEELIFDENDKLSSWQQRLSNMDMEIITRAHVKPTSLIRSWGGSTAAKTLKDNRNLPLLFDVDMKIRTDNSERNVSGRGLAEYFPVDYNIFS